MNLLATDAERRFADEVRDFVVSHLPSEVSELKVRGTELYQRLLELLMIAAGPDALAYHRDFVLGTASAPAFGPTYAATAAGRYFKWRSMSILGGSNEIQRNVVAKAVLDIR